MQGVLSATVLSLMPMIRPFEWQSLLLPVSCSTFGINLFLFEIYFLRETLFEIIWTIKCSPTSSFLMTKHILYFFKWSFSSGVHVDVNYLLCHEHSALALCIHQLIWTFLQVLPEKMQDFLDAPVPFIVSFWSFSSFSLC